MNENKLHSIIPTNSQYSLNNKNLIKKYTQRHTHTQ